MAAPYSMDLRKRVLKAWDASGDADEVAATFGVSRAWVQWWLNDLTVSCCDHAS